MPVFANYVFSFIFGSILLGISGAGGQDIVQLPLEAGLSCPIPWLFSTLIVQAFGWI